MDVFINVWYNNNDIVVTTILSDDEDFNDEYYKIDYKGETLFMAKSKQVAEEYINEKFNLNINLEKLYSIKAF